MRRVVITGMGVISPIANDVDRFYQSLISGTLGISRLTRFNTDDLKISLAAEVKDFDPYLYGMDKSDIRRIDLFCQYALAAVWQAVVQSKITDNIDPARFGVYMASGIGGIETFIQEHNKLIEKGPRRVSPYFVTKLIINMASGETAIRHNAKGPCLPVVTACASSSHAIGEAYRAIAHGYADAVIAGGAEAAINPLSMAGFANSMALSREADPNSGSIPFDLRRSGFVMGEGAGALILEEFEHAKNRGTEIYCEVTGYGNTCDAYHVTAPDPVGEQSARAIEDAVLQSGWDKNSTLYINAHGTSTPLNDKTETMAVKRVFGEETAKEKIVMSSTKSMTGHMLGAAGAVEAIASVLTLLNGVVPPTIGYTTPDPECDLDYVPNTARKLDVSTALSISLGFGGHNACLAFSKYTED
jgi:3-oxoacyl-[acyl-carrier-protein] synthase II